MSEAFADTTDPLVVQILSRRWYHTLDLGDDIVTRGWFDARRVANRMPWPNTWTGKRCLDVGTFDGFWAFEMERRGADEVLAIDILDEDRWDWPPKVDPASRTGIEEMKGHGDGFEIAKRALGSNVARRDCSIYDLDRDEHGEFDVVFVGSLLLHLRDPVLALSRVAAVTSGRLVVSDGISLRNTIAHPRRAIFALDGLGRPYWWKPNAAGLRHLLHVAGFQPLTRVRPFLMPPGPGHPRPTLRQGVLSRQGRELLFSARSGGDPHACLAASALTRQ